MRLIAKKTLRTFWERHANCRKDLEDWYAIASTADWKSPLEVKASFPKASIVANNRVVFNIAGGSYRLVVKFAYRAGIGFVRFIGTHQEYDRINASEI